jgi:hypothetical protein
VSAASVANRRRHGRKLDILRYSEIAGDPDLAVPVEVSLVRSNDRSDVVDRVFQAAFVLASGMLASFVPTARKERLQPNSRSHRPLHLATSRPCSCGRISAFVSIRRATSTVPSKRHAPRCRVCKSRSVLERSVSRAQVRDAGGLYSLSEIAFVAATSMAID